MNETTKKYSLLTFEFDYQRKCPEIRELFKIILEKRK